MILQAFKDIHIKHSLKTRYGVGVNLFRLLAEKFYIKHFIVSPSNYAIHHTTLENSR